MAGEPATSNVTPMRAGLPPGKVVVVDRFPTLSVGLAAILQDAGFEVTRPVRPESWVRRNGADAVFVTIDPATDDPLKVRPLLSAYGDSVVVAVLVSAGQPDHLFALRSGAHAAVDWSAGQAEIAAVARFALAGLVVLPASLAQALAWSAVPPEQGGSGILSADDVRWLRVLARGGSVVQLAGEEGYSQREVFRRLSGLYRRMGAENRQEAIALAARWGLLTEQRHPA